MRRRPGPDAPAAPFGILTTLLAAGLVLDQVWWGGFEVLSWHGPVVAAAFVVLVAPSSVPALAGLLAATVVSVAVDLPSVGTHRVVELVVAVAVLGQIGVTTILRRRMPGPAEVFAGAAPFLRAVVVVTYLGSALAKVNTSFLDPATSCATAMALPLVGPDLVPAAIVGTVVAEAGLPVLLLVRRTRLVGIVAGTGFHVVLALADNVPFSAVVLALYAAFLPLDTGVRLRALTGGVPRVPVAGRALVLAGLAGAWLLAARTGPAATYPGLTGPPSALVDPTVGTAATVAYVVLAAGLVGVVLVSRAGTPDPGRPADPPPWAARAVLVAAAGLLVVNAALPYIGAKTDTSFEMFSGLRTDPGTWNHLLVPEAVRVSGLSGGWVVVTAATDPALVARTAGGTRIALVELDRALRAEPGAVASYVVVGDLREHSLGPLPAGPTPVQRLVTFRDAIPVGVPRC